MRLTTRRTMLALVAAGALVGGGVFGTRYWHDREAAQAALPAVKLTSIHMTNLLRLYGSNTATYGEVIAKSEATVAEVDKAVVQLRSTADTRHPTVVQAIDFMESAQGSARTLSQVARRTLAFSVAVDSAKRADGDADSSNQFVREVALRTAVREWGEARKRLGEVDETSAAAAKTFADLRTRNAAVAVRFGADAAIEPKPLADVEATIAKKASK